MFGAHPRRLRRASGAAGVGCSALLAGPLRMRHITALHWPIRSGWQRYYGMTGASLFCPDSTTEFPNVATNCRPQCRTGCSDFSDDRI
jgi:hypothetical protein